MIKVIDNRTDEVLTDIPLDGDIIEGKHVEDAESKEETLDFTVFSDYTGLTERNRLLIQDDDDNWREFVIENIDSVDEEAEVYSNASYMEDLSRARPIAPDRLEQKTVTEYIDYALVGTDWEQGTVEYGGTRTISWSGYNSPYELLRILETRFEMSLRFRVEIDHNKVAHRYVDMVHINHLFKGKEIVRGKDLVEFKRTINTEDMATALICLGPEPNNENLEEGEEPQERLIELMYDDEANDKYNKPGHYMWQVYEPSTENEDMTVERLRTLGRTELNKRKEPKIDYDITAINLEHLYGHEKVRKYDKVRIKDEELDVFADANTKRITRNILDPTDREYTFGDITEYESDDLRAYFDSLLAGLRNRLDEAVRNSDNIRQEIEDELEDYERKVEKSDEPPENPEEGDLWLDTSGNTGVLYRYENGEWVKSSPSEAEEVGAITREAAMYLSLVDTLETLQIKHMDMQNQVNSALDSEYLVDDDIRGNLTYQLRVVDSIFTDILSEMGDMTEDTATIGKLVDVQRLVVDYRNEVHYLSIALLEAQQAINERLKLLQSQYSDEKYQEALEDIADRIDGLEVENGRLVGDINVREQLDEVISEVKDDLIRDFVSQGQYETDMDGVVTRLDNTEAEQRIQADEINQRVTSTELQQEIENYSFGNLIPQAKIAWEDGGYWSSGMNSGHAERIRLKKSMSIDVIQGETYTFSDESAYVSAINQWMIIPYDSDTDRLVEGGTTRYINRGQSATFTAESDEIILNAINMDNFTVRLSFLNPEDERIKVSLRKGDKVSPWTRSPKDALLLGEDNETRIRTNETNINQLDDEVSIKAGYTDINKSLETLDYALSELSVSAQDGFNFEYDSNGLIENYSVGPNGFIFDGSKVQFNATDEIMLRIGSAEDYADEANRKYDNIEVGGDNLIEDSQRIEKPSGTSFTVIHDGLEEGTHTISFNHEWVDNTNSSYHALLYAGSSLVVIQLRSGRTSAVFEVDESQAGQPVYIYGGRNASTSNPNHIIFHDLILSKGNVPQGWRPSSHDQVYKDRIRTEINMSEDNTLIAAETLDLVGDVNIENGQTRITDLDFDRAIAVGGSGGSTLRLQNDEIELRGQFQRTWRGERTTHDTFTRFRDGHMRFRNNDLDRSLYFSDFGISTYIDGDNQEASGILQFFDYEYSNARGVTLESALGVVALRSNDNRVVLDSQWTTNIESSQASIYVRPYRDSRPGLNEFRFWVKDNNSVSTTDGVLSYGDITGNDGHGAGLRFSKSGSENIIFATNNDGDYGTGSFHGEAFMGELRPRGDFNYLRAERTRFVKPGSSSTNYSDIQYNDGQANSLRLNTNSNFYLGVSSGELRVTNNLLYNGGDIGYRPVLAGSFQSHHSLVFASHSGGNAYFGVGGYKLRITDNNGYNGGNTEYRDIEFKNWTANSSEKFKHDIMPWDYKVLDIYKDELKFYRYRFNSENDGVNDFSRYHHGVILERELPVEWVAGNSIDGMEVINWHGKAIQEIAYENDELKERIKKLEEMVFNG